MKIDQSEILVSVCCVTFNHEKYIAQTLEGFLMQKTDFEYEIIIGDDSSTDNTNLIIQSYHHEYPHKIRLVTGEVNVGSIKNQCRIFGYAKGKYIAMCDGDDYWIDPLKLQKQVDLMERKPHCTICCHYSRVINDKGIVVYEHSAPRPLQFDYEDVLLGRKEETRTSSMMLRNKLNITRISEQGWYYKVFGSDTFLKLYALARETGKIYVLPEVMSVYRLHTSGAWSMIDPRVRKRRMISDFNILINNFDYSDKNKRKLLKLYIYQFLLFDIREMNIQSIVRNIKVLL